MGKCDPFGRVDSHSRAELFCDNPISLRYALRGHIVSFARRASNSGTPDRIVVRERANDTKWLSIFTRDAFRQCPRRGSSARRISPEYCPEIAGSMRSRMRLPAI